MQIDPMLAQLSAAKTYFTRSIDCLTEEDSSFAPAEGMMTVAQHVAHVAITLDWFLEGAFRPEGFNMDFESVDAPLAGVTSLTAAREHLERSFAAVEQAINTHSAEEWAKPLPEGPVMGGEPRFAIFGGITDHTAHHRGALTVYSRQCGHVPAMPYM